VWLRAQYSIVAGEHARAVELAAAPEHLGEAVQVARGGHVAARRDLAAGSAQELADRLSASGATTPAALSPRAPGTAAQASPRARRLLAHAERPEDLVLDEPLRTGARRHGARAHRRHRRVRDRDQ
jgi:hypothetical protein